MADKFYVQRNDGNEKTGAKTNWAWYFGIFLLVLISVSFILPATGFATGKSRGIYFGKFGNRKIEYSISQDRTPSLFANIAEQYHERYSSMYSQAGSGSLDLARYSGYSEAFSAVLEHYAKLYYVEKSKLDISDKEATQFILKNYKSSESGKFNADWWKRLPQETKKLVREDAKDSIAVSHFDEDYSKIKDNSANLDFVIANLGEAKNFNMIFFDGDDAKSAAEGAIAKLNSGESMESVKAEGKDVIKVENTYKNYIANSFYPTRSSFGEMGALLSKIDSDTALRDGLFSLGLKSIYPDPIEISDGKWAVVEMDSLQTPEQSEVIKGSIEGRIKYLDSGDFSARIRKSPLCDDKFSDGYFKLFPMQ